RHSSSRVILEGRGKRLPAVRINLAVQQLQPLAAGWIARIEAEQAIQGIGGRCECAVREMQVEQPAQRARGFSILSQLAVKAAEKLEIGRLGAQRFGDLAHQRPEL